MILFCSCSWLICSWHHILFCSAKFCLLSSKLVMLCSWAWWNDSVLVQRLLYHVLVFVLYRGPCRVVCSGVLLGLSRVLFWWCSVLSLSLFSFLMEWHCSVLLWNDIVLFWPLHHVLFYHVLLRGLVEWFCSVLG